MAAVTQTALVLPTVPGVVLVFSQDRGGNCWVSVQDLNGTANYQISRAQMLAIAAAANIVANA